MKSSIVFLIVLSFPGFISGQTFSRKDTLRFAPDSSYSRAIVHYGKDLVFGTSRNGVIKLSEGTGKTEIIIPPSESGEFRGVAVSKEAVFGMVSGDNGEIWRADKYETVKIIDYKGDFFDDLKIHGNAFVMLGDPADGIFVLEKLGLNLLSGTGLNAPSARKDEACYAASASSLLFPSDSVIMFISGGKESARFHKTTNEGKTWMSVDLPMNKGEGCGPFSVHFTDSKRGMIAGGCYTSPNAANASSLYTEDGGKTWKVSEKTTNGYRSCVTGNRKIQFACGTNGIDVSTDGGKTWKIFDKGNYCALLLEKKFLYATTNKGYAVKYKLK